MEFILLSLVIELIQTSLYLSQGSHLTIIIIIIIIIITLLYSHIKVVHNGVPVK